MNWNSKENNQQKHQFKSYYCSKCKQYKTCGTLIEYTDWESYCCLCYYERKYEKAQEYSDYQLVYQQKVREKKNHDKQLLLLKNYQGCKECGSLEVDAFSLYENSQLVCQPCRMRKEGGSSGPINFLEQRKWYKRYWGIDLEEWLGKFSQLPVNAECAREWVRDKEHLENCDCLEKEVKELVEMFGGSLQENRKKLANCSCEKSEKVRVGSDYYAWCEKCGKSIKAASKKRVIKNRNDPRFWGLEVEERVLCLGCLEEKKGEMTAIRRAKFNEYRKLGMI